MQWATRSFSTGGPCRRDLACPTAPTEVRLTSPGASGSLLLASGYAPSMTDDGRQVLYLSDRTGSTQIYMIGTDGVGDRQLTSEADGITRAIISGDGTVSYAVTGHGRLIRIATAAGTVLELIPSTPYLGTSFNVGLTYLTALPALAPDKLVSLPGVGLSPSAVTAKARPPVVAKRSSGDHPGNHGENRGSWAGRGDGHRALRCNAGCRGASSG